MIVHSIEYLTKEQDVLEHQIAKLRESARDLENAKSRMDELTERTRVMGAELAGLEGQFTAKNAEMNEVQYRLVATRSTYNELRNEFDSLSAAISVARQRQQDLEQEHKRRLMVWKHARLCGLVRSQGYLTRT